jgi:transcriptional regulator with XRE-family HTH domain
MMSETVSLAELLIKFRDILDESQKEVAEQLDLPPPSLSFYENEERLPPFDVLVELLDHYDAHLVVETDLGKWTFEMNGDDELKLKPEEKTDEIGLLSGIDEEEKEDLIAYIRRRRRKNQDTT